MNTRLQKMYARVRKASPVMLVGSNAQCSIDIARAIIQWEQLKVAGLVRMFIDEDQDADFFYLDTWEHLSERSKENHIEKYRDNVVIVSGQFRVRSDAEWETGDSIGGCIGYDRPASPFENCYVSGIMEETIKALRHALKTRCPCCRKVA